MAIINPLMNECSDYPVRQRRSSADELPFGQLARQFARFPPDRSANRLPRTTASADSGPTSVPTVPAVPADVPTDHQTAAPLSTADGVPATDHQTAATVHHTDDTDDPETGAT